MQELIVPAYIIQKRRIDLFYVGDQAQKPYNHYLFPKTYNTTYTTAKKDSLINAPSLEMARENEFNKGSCRTRFSEEYQPLTICVSRMSTRHI
jgi:hypothetical protein